MFALWTWTKGGYLRLVEPVADERHRPAERSERRGPLRSLPDQDDHVVTPFKLNGLWGAISKTNHSVLRYRDPVYRDVRELAMSYFHEFYEKDRRKSLLEYSAPFDLSRYPLKRWLVADDELYWLTEALDKSRHYQTVPKRSRRHLRLVAPVELRAMTVIEWSRRGRRYA